MRLKSTIPRNPARSAIGSPVQQYAQTGLRPARTPAVSAALSTYRFQPGHASPPTTPRLYKRRTPLKLRVLASFRNDVGQLRGFAHVGHVVPIACDSNKICVDKVVLDHSDLLIERVDDPALLQGTRQQPPISPPKLESCVHFKAMPAPTRFFPNNRHGQSQRLARLFGPTLAAAIISLTPRQALADDWWGRDKALHFSYSFALSLGGYAAGTAVFDKPWQRALTASAFSLSLGAAKELWDAGGHGDASWRDMAWNGIGTASGVTLAFSLDVSEVLSPTPH